MIQRSVIDYEMKYSNWHIHTLPTGYKTWKLFVKISATSEDEKQIPLMERNTTVLADIARANPKSQSCKQARNNVNGISTIVAQWIRITT